MSEVSNAGEKICLDISMYIICIMNDVFMRIYSGRRIQRGLEAALRVEDQQRPVVFPLWDPRSRGRAQVSLTLEGSSPNKRARGRPQWRHPTKAWMTMTCLN